MKNVKIEDNGIDCSVSYDEVSTVKKTVPFDRIEQENMVMKMRLVEIDKEITDFIDTKEKLKDELTAKIAQYDEIISQVRMARKQTIIDKEKKDAESGNIT